MLTYRNIKVFLGISSNIHGVRYLNNKSAWITKIRRKTYLRKYPTMLVQPDGSTLTIRHFEPRRIIKLPLDITTVSPELRQEILERRKPKKKVIIEEDVDVNFNYNRYLKFMQKKS